MSRFNVAAQPLRFLDYLIENPEQGVVVNGGGILVNVPTSARFAFHKLIVSQEREVVMPDKMEKDIMQAAQVFSLLADERPGDLLLAWDEIKRRGKGWVKRVSAGLSVMEKRHRAGYEMVLTILPELKKS
ncbi:MAG: GSU2403 family nucleotidyltransferase fold protein [bacterium]